MAGFGMILGGAMSGWSDARLDEIKAEREARLQELEAQRQDRRLAEERDFRSKEAEIGRNFDASQTEKSQAFTSSENQKERDYRSTEAGKAREASGDLVTDDKGTTYSRTGSTAKPLVDDKGNPIKVASGGKAADKPAEVSTAEWLISQGVASTPAEAWKMVRSARADPDKSRASIYKAWLDALTKGALGTPDAADLQKQAQDATEKTLQYLDQEPSDAGAGSQGGSGASKAATPRTQDTEDVVTPANVIPSDPAKRVINKVYINKNGQMARWKGNGWEPVQ
jgi:hypothetical protein